MLKSFGWEEKRSSSHLETAYFPLSSVCFLPDRFVFKRFLYPSSHQHQSCASEWLRRRLPAPLNVGWDALICSQTEPSNQKGVLETDQPVWQLAELHHLKEPPLIIIETRWETGRKGSWDAVALF